MGADQARGLDGPVRKSGTVGAFQNEGARLGGRPKRWTSGRIPGSPVGVWVLGGQLLGVWTLLPQAHTGRPAASSPAQRRTVNAQQTPSAGGTCGYVVIGQRGGGFTDVIGRL